MGAGYSRSMELTFPLLLKTRLLIARADVIRRRPLPNASLPPTQATSICMDFTATRLCGISLPPQLRAAAASSILGESSCLQPASAGDTIATFDYIVIGSGIAGLYAAHYARQSGSVLVLTKGRLSQSNTRYAQGGVAAAVASGDSPALHWHDTIVAGAGLCDPYAVMAMVSEGPACVRELMTLGVSFDTLHGEIDLAKEGAHSVPRVLHARGDATGAEIEGALSRHTRRTAVTIRENHLATRLLVQGGRCVGVEALDERTRSFHVFRSRNVILCSGGAGQLFAYTTNPSIATGDGVALAFQAGAGIADMEFFQFHPTALRKTGAPSFLISEAVRGAGAYLRNRSGERFMARYHELAELAPRDVVSRAAVTEMARTGGDCVYLDLRHMDAAETRTHFPTIYSRCRQYGIDITTDLVPVAPAAHYMTGGVLTDLRGRTSLPGLYACGEVACTGVHGANRLASNSLLEALVFARRIVLDTLGLPVPDYALPEEGEPALAPNEHVRIPLPSIATERKRAGGALPALKQLMWHNTGIVREESEMVAAEEQVRTWLARTPIGTRRRQHEYRSSLILGLLLTTGARRRSESRGAHFRQDNPEPSDAWRHRIVIYPES